MIAPKEVPNTNSLAAAAAKSLQLCPTLFDPIDNSPLGSSVHGILQARIMEWVDISFSKFFNNMTYLYNIKSLFRQVTFTYREIFQAYL